MYGSAPSSFLFGQRADNYGGCFFFFQAEDGIRDYKVTGVQTCALPISGFSRGSISPLLSASAAAHARRTARARRPGSGTQAAGARTAPPAPPPARADAEIGRASCRERV